MLSNRSYLLRAFYEWIVDSDCTPILVIDANHPRCQIPQDFAEGGEIVFNISSSAIRNLNISYDLIEFKASFSGVIHLISAPIKAILAIYAEENGEGIFFDAEEDETGAEGIVQLKEVEKSPRNSSVEHENAFTHQAPRKPFLKLIE